MKPLINDITTSFDNPPQFKELAKKYPNRDYMYHQEFKQKQESYYSIFPLRIKNTQDTVFTLAHEITQEQGWKIVSVDKSQSRIEAVATTSFFRFKDDIVIEIRVSKDGLIEVHMRSKSRLGKGDFGANARRISLYLKCLEEKLTGTLHNAYTPSARK